MIKLNPSATDTTYATFLDFGETGPSGTALAVDSSGNAYLTGTTASTFLPTTRSAFQSFFAGGESDAFVIKLGATGNALIYATYIGGSGSDGAPRYCR